MEHKHNRGNGKNGGNGFARRLREYGEAVGQFMDEYMRELNMAVRLLNIGAPAVGMADERGHLTILERRPMEVGGFSKARGPRKRLVELPREVTEKLEAMSELLKAVGEKLKDIPEIADVEIEGVRLSPALRRLVAAAVLQRPELFKELQEVDKRRDEIAAEIMKLMEGVQLPACPHKDPETGQVCGLPTRPVVVHNTHIEMLGLQHVATAASALARAEQLIKLTTFDIYMRLQGVGPSALMFLFWAAAVNREPDRPSRLYSYLGLAPAAYCPRCNALYKGSVKVCPKCGKPTVPTLPTKVVSALTGAPVKVRTKARTRAWVLGQVLLSQARLGRAPSVMAAIADLASLHYQRYMDCWYKSGKDPDAMAENACAGLRMIHFARKYPSRYEEFAVNTAVANAVLEVVKIYIAAASDAAAYLAGRRPASPYGQHKRFYPPTLFWKAGEDPPPAYVEWFGVHPDEERRRRLALLRKGEELAGIYQQKRKGEDSEAWIAWREVFAAAQQLT